MGRSLVGRVLSRLIQAERQEVNPHYQDDYRIARLTLLNAADGVREPAVAATYQVLGLHPSKVWPAIVARRKAKLGREYAAFFEDGEKTLPAKKPAHSVRWPAEEVRRRVGEERVERLKANGADLDGPRRPRCFWRRPHGFAADSISQFGRA